MVIRRIGPLSFAKVTGILYALMGFIIGIIFSLVSMIGGAMMPHENGGMMGMIFGVGAIIALPIFYGILGFLTSLVGAVLYNVVAGWVGGIEIETT